MIKYGSGVSVIEGENMLFIRRERTIPVPRVYAVCTSTKTVLDKHNNNNNKEVPYNYIIMEHVDGNTLESEWESLTAQQNEQISTQLSGHVNQLRSIPSPGYYGSIGKRGLLDCVFWTGNDATEPLGGPFATEQAFNEAMRKKYIYNGVRSKSKALWSSISCYLPRPCSRLHAWRFSTQEHHCQKNTSRAFC
jgi:hypothetical protein